MKDHYDYVFTKLSHLKTTASTVAQSVDGWVQFESATHYRLFDIVKRHGFCYMCYIYFIYNYVWCV